MAATTRPKPVGLGLKPRFPLRLQRIDDPGLVSPVENHGDPERSSLSAAPGFGIYTRLTGMALNGSVSCWILSASS